jgi:hypothetical protein
MSNGAAFGRTYPADLREGAGTKVLKRGLFASVSLDYRGIAKVTQVPETGLVVVRNKDSVELQVTDFQQLPVVTPANGAVTNQKLRAAPGLTLERQRGGRRSPAAGRAVLRCGGDP